MLLDNHRVTREFENIVVRQGITMAVGLGDIHRSGAAAGRAGLGEHHLDKLGAQIAADDRPLTLRQGGLMDIELVGIHGALHHRFAQTVTRRDEHHLVETGFGIQGEDHP